MHERQAVIFGVLLAAVAFAGLGSALVYTGHMTVPFLDRGFSSPEPTAFVAADSPCPPAGALPVPYGEITVNVYNGTSRPGLANQTADALSSRGFVIASKATAPERLDGAPVVQFGATSVAAAYTLAAHLDGALLVLDDRADTTIDLTVGSTFNRLVDASAVTLAADVPLAVPAECTPLEQVVPIPAPVATDDAAAAEGEPAEDPATEDAPAEG